MIWGAGKSQIYQNPLILDGNRRCWYLLVADGIRDADLASDWIYFNYSRPESPPNNLMTTWQVATPPCPSRQSDARVPRSRFHRSYLQNYSAKNSQTSHTLRIALFELSDQTSAQSIIYYEPQMVENFMKWRILWKHRADGVKSHVTWTPYYY